MKRKQRSFVNDQTCACKICEKSIDASAEPCCTLVMERGIFGKGRERGGPQTFWAHGKCLIRQIPIVGYSFPELLPKKPRSSARGGSGKRAILRRKRKPTVRRRR